MKKVADLRYLKCEKSIFLLSNRYLFAFLTASISSIIIGLMVLRNFHESDNKNYIYHNTSVYAFFLALCMYYASKAHKMACAEIQPTRAVALSGLANRVLLLILVTNVAVALWIMWSFAELWSGHR